MRKSGVERLIILSVTFLFKDTGMVSRIVGNTFFRNIKAGSAEMEEVIRSSGLKWKIARLPRLIDSPTTTEYRARREQTPPALSIANGSLACFVLDEVEQNRFVRTTVGVSA
jgi:hypothetical protein